MLVSRKEEAGRWLLFFSGEAYDDSVLVSSEKQVINVKRLRQFPPLCGRTTSDRVVKITTSSILMHYLLRYETSSGRETEKTAELRVLPGPQQYVCLWK